MISVFDLFSIGIGPSSSHTVGPMRAAAMFARSLAGGGALGEVAGIRAELFGSLGATGHGHGSVPAVVLGLSGQEPETVDPAAAAPLVDAVRASGILPLPGTAGISFAVDDDIILHRRQRLPFHPNAIRFTALDGAGGEVSTRTYYSIGGGFVLGEDAAGQRDVLQRHGHTRRAHEGFDDRQQGIGRERRGFIDLRPHDFEIWHACTFGRRACLGRPETEHFRARGGMISPAGPQMDCPRRGRRQPGIRLTGVRRAPYSIRGAAEKGDIGRNALPFFWAIGYTARGGAMPGAGTDKTKRWKEGPGPVVILVEPQLGENIGAAARVMANFGLSRLRLVRPRQAWPNDKARMMAAGADRVLDGAALYDTLEAAIAVHVRHGIETFAQRERAQHVVVTFRRS